MASLTRIIARPLLIFILIAFPIACDRSPTGSKAPTDSAVAVRLQPVVTQPVQRSVDVTGTLYGNEETTISAKVSGRIASIARDMGDRCRAGELLLQIDRTDYELAHRQKELAVREVLAKLGLEYLPTGDFDPATVPTVQQAKLKAENAEAKYNRGRQLHEQTPPLMSDQDFADLKTAFEVAKSDYDVALLTARSLLNEARSLQAQADMARQTLADASVLAPKPIVATDNAASQPGTEQSYAIAARLVSVGEYVREGTPLFRLIDDDPIKLRAAVPERYAADVNVGQAAKVRVEAYADEFTGRVTRINPQIDPASRTFTVEVLIPNSAHRLKAGAFARASVLTRVDDRVVFVPREAVVNFAGVSKVFTVGADGKAIEHAVEVNDAAPVSRDATRRASASGDHELDLVEVIRGLDGTESVVVEGASKLATGVTTKQRSAPTTR